MLDNCELNLLEFLLKKGMEKIEDGSVFQSNVDEILRKLREKGEE